MKKHRLNFKANVVTCKLNYEVYVDNKFYNSCHKNDFYTYIITTPEGVSKIKACFKAILTKLIYIMPREVGHGHSTQH